MSVSRILLYSPAEKTMGSLKRELLVYASTDELYTESVGSY